ncbi:hypothetical protein D3C86_1324640 [compost metagenome]
MKTNQILAIQALEMIHIGIAATSKEETLDLVAIKGLGRLHEEVNPLVGAQTTDEPNLQRPVQAVDDPAARANLPPDPVYCFGVLLKHLDTRGVMPTFDVELADTLGNRQVSIDVLAQHRLPCL